MTVIDFFFQSLFKLNHLTSLLYIARPNAHVSPEYPIIVVMGLRVHTVAQAKQSRKEISGKSVFLYFAAWGTHVGRVSGVFPSAQTSGASHTSGTHWALTFRGQRQIPSLVISAVIC